MSVFLKARNPNKDIFPEYAVCVDEVVCNKLTQVHPGPGPTPNPASSASCTVNVHYPGTPEASAQPLNVPIVAGASADVESQGNDIDASGNATSVTTNTTLVNANTAKSVVCGVRLPPASVISPTATGWNLAIDAAILADFVIGTPPISIELVVAFGLDSSIATDVITTKYSSSVPFGKNETSLHKFSLTVPNSQFTAGAVKNVFVYWTVTANGGSSTDTVKSGNLSITATPTSV